MGRQLMNLAKVAAHSGTARTHPRDDDTDLYPVPLSREALRPGVVYADPYGHLMVVARWIPQGAGDRYGILMAADAQPDGTVGRRRFFRGSFLFTPDTTDVGAGFKAWRPIVARGSDRMEALSNRQLTASTTYVPFSEEQYQGSADDFYDRMEALINPRPLDAELMLVALVDALLQAVVRRVDSVDNGEEYLRERSWAAIDMPEGYAVFETSGAWEDFSTPARDMRLLISIDAVLGFADAVARAPERFALTAAQVPATQAAIRRRLDAELPARTFTYTRTDGSTQTLSLRDVVDRRERFEMAYNPNDCAETRWGAEPGSAEHEPCNRRAPQWQRDRMAEYRTWFIERRRPPRPN
jgi:hypothetical protein